MKNSSCNNTDLRLTANVLKEVVATFLLSLDSDGVIGYEVMYGSSRRVADMVFISKGHSYAVEIKSEFDTTSRLEGQLKEYQTLFDYILIFSAPNHIDTVTAILPKHVGLYSISHNGIHKIQRPKINRFVQKSEMLISIPSATIKRDFSVKGKLTSDEIRSCVLKRSYKTIHNYFINYYQHRLRIRNEKNNIMSPMNIKVNDAVEDYLII